MDLKLINKFNLENLKVPNNIDKVFLIKENKGYVFILNNTINKIYILIKEEYRGNGYGKQALKDVLKQFNEELIFETANPIVVKMLVYVGGINVGNTNGVSRIKIYVKN